MTEYIVSVPNECAEYFTKTLGFEDVRLLGFKLEGDVVRCRDCRRYEDDCDWNNPDLEEPDGYCAWACRKDKEADA